MKKYVLLVVGTKKARRRRRFFMDFLQYYPPLRFHEKMMKGGVILRDIYGYFARIQKGVFEKLPYPWFAPKMQVFESGAVQDMCGEDVSFCLDAIEEGYEIWCDPRIRVGHEKTRII